MSTGCFSWCPLLTRWGFKKPIAENLKSDEVSVDSCRSNSLIHKCLQKLPFLGFHLPSTTTNESSRLVGGPCFPPTTTSPPLDHQPPPLDHHHHQRVTTTCWWFPQLPCALHRHQQVLATCW